MSPFNTPNDDFKSLFGESQLIFIIHSFIYKESNIKLKNNYEFLGIILKCILVVLENDFFVQEFLLCPSKL